MNDLVHCPSGQRGAIVGRSSRCFMVKTDSGHIQTWAKHSTYLLKEDYMTSKILIKLTGGPNKLYSVIERIFNTAFDAAEYLVEVARIDGIKEMSKDGLTATLGNGWTLYSNYDLKEVMKKIPSHKDLWDWYPFDLQKKLRKRLWRSPTPSSSTTTTPSLTAPPKKQLSGKTVKLQDITSDGRAARVILRELVRKKKIVKNGRWEWEEGDPQLEIVREANKGAKK